MMKNLANLPLIILLLFSMGITSQAQKQTTKKSIEILWNHPIPMRDGTKLSAHIYKPKHIEKPLPVLFSLSPYVSDHNHERGEFFSRRGYIYVAVDCRGRGNSEGEFTPFKYDGKDGYDVTEWLAKQSWSDGQVAMLGGSYLGMTQWLTLKQLPPSLKTIVPTAAVGPGIDFPKLNNMFYPYDVRWLAFVRGNTKNQKLFYSNFWQDKWEEAYKVYLPFNQIDKFVGFPNKAFQEWLTHPDFDDYWKNILPKEEEYKKMNIPILTITGHFDADQPGAMNYYKSFMKYASKKAKGEHYLIMGPWTHRGTREPAEKFGDMVFGKKAVINMHQLHLDWFDWKLKGKKRPKILKDKVTYFEMGSNDWKYAPDLKSLSNKEVDFLFEFKGWQGQ